MWIMGLGNDENWILRPKNLELWKTPTLVDEEVRKVRFAGLLEDVEEYDIMGAAKFLSL